MMLDAFVIEEIKRRERDRRREDRPVIELPIPAPGSPADSSDGEKGEVPEQNDRGVVIIDYAS